MHVHHVGIATDDLPELRSLFRDLLDAPIVHEEETDELRIVFVDLGNGYLELLEPVADGTIARFIEDRGPGIHHVAVETDDIEAALDRARDMGIDRVDEAPRPGAWGHDIAFLHPRSTGGVLVEFVEE